MKIKYINIKRKRRRKMRMAEEGGCRVGGVPEVVGVERRKIRLRAAANCTATPWVALTAAAAPPGDK